MLMMLIGQSAALVKEDAASRTSIALNFYAVFLRPLYSSI
jgi:hypothetical protein